MTPDDLRALADALEPMARAPRFEDFDVPGFCAWLRACADAKPVGYFGKSAVDGVWIEMEPWATNAIPLYTHPAPAAPQAEPKRQPVSEATALIEWPESAKWKNRAAPEGIERSCMGEPKREPLSDERIAEIQRAAYERAAQECDEWMKRWQATIGGPLGAYREGKAGAASTLAERIRALGRQHD